MEHTHLRFRWAWETIAPMDMAIFNAAMTISVGNGEKGPSWEAPWLNGRKPKD
jgi:hypothetical protein